jgi:hypothetical protein
MTSEPNRTDGLKNRSEYSEERFEEFCIRTGHIPFGAQGIDGSKYDYNMDGRVVRRGLTPQK